MLCNSSQSSLSREQLQAVKALLQQHANIFQGFRSIFNGNAINENKMTKDDIIITLNKLLGALYTINSLSESPSVSANCSPSQDDQNDTNPDEEKGDCISFKDSLSSPMDPLHFNFDVSPVTHVQSYKRGKRARANKRQDSNLLNQLRQDNQIENVSQDSVNESQISNDSTPSSISGTSSLKSRNRKVRNPRISPQPTIGSPNSSSTTTDVSEKYDVIYMLVPKSLTGVKIGYTTASLDVTTKRYKPYTNGFYIKYYKIDRSKFQNNSSDYIAEQTILHQLKYYGVDSSQSIPTDIQQILDDLGFEEKGIAVQSSFKGEWFVFRGVRNTDPSTLNVLDAEDISDENYYKEIVFLRYYDRLIRRILSDGLNNVKTYSKQNNVRRVEKQSLTEHVAEFQNTLPENTVTQIYNYSKTRGSNMRPEGGGQQPLDYYTTRILSQLIYNIYYSENISRSHPNIRTKSITSCRTSSSSSSSTSQSSDQSSYPVIFWAGCGYGEEAIMICKFFQNSKKKILIFGIDIDENVVEMANKNATIHHVSGSFRAYTECLYSLQIEKFMGNKTKINIVYTSAVLDTLFSLKLLYIAAKCQCDMIVDSSTSYKAYVATNFLPSYQNYVNYPDICYKDIISGYLYDGKVSYERKKTNDLRDISLILHHGLVLYSQSNLLGTSVENLARDRVVRVLEELIDRHYGLQTETGRWSNASSSSGNKIIDALRKKKTMRGSKSPYKYNFNENSWKFATMPAEIEFSHHELFNGDKPYLSDAQEKHYFPRVQHFIRQIFVDHVISMKIVPFKDTDNIKKIEKYREIFESNYTRILDYSSESENDTAEDSEESSYKFSETSKSETEESGSFVASEEDEEEESCKRKKRKVC